MMVMARAAVMSQRVVRIAEGVIGWGVRVGGMTRGGGARRRAGRHHVMVTRCSRRIVGTAHRSLVGDCAAVADVLRVVVSTEDAAVWVFVGVVPLKVASWGADGRGAGRAVGHRPADDG